MIKNNVKLKSENTVPVGQVGPQSRQEALLCKNKKKCMHDDFAACAHLVEDRRKKKLFSSPLSDIWIFIAFFASKRYSRFIPMRKIFFI